MQLVMNKNTKNHVDNQYFPFVYRSLSLIIISLPSIGLPMPPDELRDVVSLKYQKKMIRLILVRPYVFWWKFIRLTMEARMK
jgi:hypothetical protein